jgi:hypothetical protein
MQTVFGPRHDKRDTSFARYSSERRHDLGSERKFSLKSICILIEIFGINNKDVYEFTMPVPEQCQHTFSPAPMQRMQVFEQDNEDFYLKKKLV